MNLLLLLLVGVSGGYMARLMNMPGGAAIGALLGVVVWNVVVAQAVDVPGELGFIAEVLIGVVIGASVTREAVGGIGALLLPAGIILLVLSLATLGLTLLLHHVFGVDIVTALFATAPGGLANMAIVAKSTGGDAFVVSVIQLVRLLGVFLIIPPLARFLTN